MFGFLTWYGVWDLKVAAFASDQQIRRATAGDKGVWKEAEVAAPSACNLKDLIFVVAASGMLLVFIAAAGLLLGLVAMPMR
jgi:hypothetical protein